MSEIEIFSVSFAEAGVAIDYALSTDVRVDGKAIRMSTLQLSFDHPDYRDDAMLLRAQAQRMLKSALSDFEDSPPFVFQPSEADDVDGGMGVPPGGAG